MKKVSACMPASKECTLAILFDVPLFPHVPLFGEICAKFNFPRFRMDNIKKAVLCWVVDWVLAQKQHKSDLFCCEVYCVLLGLKCVADGVWLWMKFKDVRPTPIFTSLCTQKYIHNFINSMFFNIVFSKVVVFVCNKRYHKFNGKLCTLWACLLG